MLSLSLTPQAQKAFDRLAGDLTRIFGPRFVALVAYGPAASVAFARDLDGADFDALAVLVPAWHKERLATPLVLTPDEFTRSLDAFPLEYQAILDRHLLIAGENPFAGATVNPDDLRRACEVQAKGHLVHLRQGWLEAEGHSGRLADLVYRSAAPLHALLSNVARLSGAPAETNDDLVTFADRVIGMPADLVRAVLAPEIHGEHHGAVPGGFAAYVAAADRLWAFIDTWRTR